MQRENFLREENNPIHPQGPTRDKISKCELVTLIRSFPLLLAVAAINSMSLTRPITHVIPSSASIYFSFMTVPAPLRTTLSSTFNGEQPCPQH